MYIFISINFQTSMSKFYLEKENQFVFKQQIPKVFILISFSLQFNNVLH